MSEAKDYKDNPLPRITRSTTWEKFDEDWWSADASGALFIAISSTRAGVLKTTNMSVTCLGADPSTRIEPGGHINPVDPNLAPSLGPSFRVYFVLICDLLHSHPLRTVIFTSKTVQWGV